jgi:membrane fusion protein, multidrug efflux system
MKLTVVLLSAAALVSCGHEAAPRTEAAPAAQVAVKTSTAELQNWPAAYEANGTVRARTTATIASKVMGYVQQVSVQTGDRVRPGQPLVTIDARDLEANLRRAEAGRAEAQSAVPEVENGIAAAKAQLDLAQATFRRIQDLAEKKSVSSQEFDEASARFKAAQANYEMARARLPQLQSKIAQADEAQRTARVTLDYAGIAAPFAGVVTARSVEPGNLVAPGAPLLTIEREGSYRLEVEVDESKVAAVGAGKSVKVTLDALGRSFDARVSEVVPAVDAASRAYTVKIDLPPMPEIRSGLSGKASFSLSTRPALAIPTAALHERGQLQSVFVIENGVARTRLITTGQRFQDAWEVLSGLSAGETVVTAPATLADGARVEVGP